MKTMTITMTAAAVLMLCAAGPVAAQNREHQQMAADLRMLQEQQQQLALSMAQLADAINGITARIDEATNVSRKGLADQKLVVDASAVDLRNVRERLDDSNVRLGTLGEEVDAIRKSISTLAQLQAQLQNQLQTQLQLVPGAVPADGSTSPPAMQPQVPLSAPVPAAGSAGPLPPSTAGLSPTRMYEEAFSDYAGGKFTSATAGFEAFLRAFPDSGRADDAQFYIGETAAAQGQFAAAVAAYNAVIKNYPAGDQVPLAYYKRGVAQERLGQTDEARASWEAVVRLYPDSDGGRLAGQRLRAKPEPTPQASPAAPGR